MRNSTSILWLGFLILILGIFLIILVAQFFFYNDFFLNQIAGVFAGALLLFRFLKTAVLVYFLVYIIYDLSVLNIKFTRSSEAFKPDFRSLLALLAGDLVCLLSLQRVNRRKA